MGAKSLICAFRPAPKRGQKFQVYSLKFLPSDGRSVSFRKAEMVLPLIRAVLAGRLVEPPPSPNRLTLAVITYASCNCLNKKQALHVLLQRMY